MRPPLFAPPRASVTAAEALVAFSQGAGAKLRAPSSPPSVSPPAAEAHQFDHRPPAAAPMILAAEGVVVQANIGRADYPQDGRPTKRGILGAQVPKQIPNHVELGAPVLVHNRAIPVAHLLPYEQSTSSAAPSTNGPIAEGVHLSYVSGHVPSYVPSVVCPQWAHWEAQQQQQQQQQQRYQQQQQQRYQQQQQRYQHHEQYYQQYQCQHQQQCQQHQQQQLYQHQHQQQLYQHQQQLYQQQQRQYPLLQNTQQEQEQRRRQLVAIGACSTLREVKFDNARHDDMAPSNKYALKRKFDAFVMCHYTPRHPSKLPTRRWVSLNRLYYLIWPHAPMDVWLKGPGNLKQLIADWYKGHPAFVGLGPDAWIKRLKRTGPPGGKSGYQFCFAFASAHPEQSCVLDAGHAAHALPGSGHLTSSNSYS